jgi:hypothetical protein
MAQTVLILRCRARTEPPRARASGRGRMAQTVLILRCRARRASLEGRTLPFEQGHELTDCAPCVGADLGPARRKPVAQQQPDLHVPPHKSEKGAEGRLGVVEGEKAGIAGRLQQGFPERCGRGRCVRTPHGTPPRGSARWTSATRSRPASSPRRPRGFPKVPRHPGAGGPSCPPAPWRPASAPWRSAARRGRRTICRAFPWNSSHDARPRSSSTCRRLRAAAPARRRAPRPGGRWARPPDAGPVPDSCLRRPATVPYVTVRRYGGKVVRRQVRRRAQPTSPPVMSMVAFRSRPGYRSPPRGRSESGNTRSRRRRFAPAR